MPDPSRTAKPSRETASKSPQGIAWTIAVAMFSRFLLNTARRFAYPFAPALSRGLGVPLTAITSLIAANQATGLLGLFFGPWIDRLGYRLMMLAGMGMLAIGLLAGGFLPFYGVVLAALFLAGLGKSIFDPALLAYVGQRVPFHRRGLMIGLVEVSWAGSSLIGIPLVGLLIEWQGWRAPFFTLGGLGLAALAVLKLLVRKDDNSTSPPHGRGILKSWAGLIRDRSVAGVLGFIFFTSAANDNLFVIYGAWLEKDFKLSILSLGLSTGVIGAAELLGEGLTASLSDRLGLKRAIIVGLCLSILSYVALPLIGQTVALALAGLFTIFLTVEFTIVTAISLCTELLPRSRATMLSSYLAAASLGRIAGALLGGPIWLGGGMLAVGAASAIMSGIALAALVWGLRIWQAGPPAIE